MELQGFKNGQIHRLGRLLDLARELTAEFYHMGKAEALGVPYDVRTLASLDSAEIRNEGVLADIVRYGYEDARFGRKKDLFRVNLQDHNILLSLKPSATGVRFTPLLLYVLTHELVHVIRFVKFLAPFYQADAGVQEEELRVNEITHKILSKINIPGMQDVIRRLDKEVFPQ